MTAAHSWMTAENRNDIAFVYFAEFDHLPLVSDLNTRLVERLRNEGCDLLGYHLCRIDETSHPHYLYHIAQPGFRKWLDDISVRRDHAVVLAMLATGSFWTRQCFDAVAAQREPLPIYVEVYLPTVAHHLGFRARGYAEQSRFVSHQGERSGELAAARASGAWSLHPVKAPMTAPIPA
jgi:hypothetical protein